MGTVLGFAQDLAASPVPLSFTPLLRLNREHVCDPMACLSGVHSLTIVSIIPITTLKAQLV
jgi:hypothetical protein